MKVYYAHFLGTYNTKQEQRDIETITKIFADAEIINPNNPVYSEAYKTQGMELFLGLVDKCDVLVFRGCVNGKIPAGVYKEISRAKERQMPILELPSYIGREMTIEDTRQMLLEIGTR